MAQTFTSIGEVLQDLQKRAKNRSQADKSVGSENINQYECPKCKDKGFILKNIPDLDQEGNQKTWPNGTPKFYETIV